MKHVYRITGPNILSIDFCWLYCVADSMEEANVIWKSHLGKILEAYKLTHSTNSIKLVARYLRLPRLPLQDDGPKNNAKNKYLLAIHEII